MSVAAGIFTLVLAVLAAQGPRAGAARSKGTRVPATPAAARAVKRSPPSSSVRPHVVPAPRKDDTSAAAPRRATATTQGAAADSGASAGATSATTSDVAETTTTTPGGKAAKTKVYSFGAMDVEGKLKTPQLLYFLNRVKLELEMSAPDHRSFMKELEKTAEDPNL